MYSYPFFTKEMGLRKLLICSRFFFQMSFCMSQSFQWPSYGYLDMCSARQFVSLALSCLHCLFSLLAAGFFSEIWPNGEDGHV